MKTYDDNIFLSMVRSCRFAYFDEGLEEALIKHNFSLIARFGKIGDISGYLAKGPEFYVLAFQGTVITEWQTVKHDLQFWFTKKQGVAYNEGFYEAYEELRPEFEPLIVGLDLPLYITGHSLGGAIALITALNLDKGVFEACYTCGAPKVCGVSGERQDEGKAIFRVEHCSDIVPCLPPGYWPFIGQLIYITDTQRYTGWQAYTRRIAGMILPIIQKSIFGMAGFLQNHFVEKYYRVAKTIVALKEDL